MSCTCLKKMVPGGFLTVLLGVGAAATAHAQAFSVVYNFGSQANDPIQPFYSGIIAQGRDGNLYSSGYAGAAYGRGATYKITPAGTLTTLNSFGSGDGDGAYPAGGLTLGTDGNFYGTTYGGGAVVSGSYGSVFKMTPGGSVTTLYAFTDGTDGALPIAPPIQGTDGNFYGTTCVACNGPAASGYGSIYKITPSETFSLLYDFDITHGWAPNDPLIEGPDGNFYGTAEYGGTSGCGCGTIFKITPAGEFTVLYNFDSTHGAYPIGPLVQGTNGNFYGTTVSGGASNFGVVFEMTPAGKLKVLHSMNGGSDGYAPFAGLVQATDANFYGANYNGGAVSSNCSAGCGTVFKITPEGSFSVLYNFDETTGWLPYTTLYQHTNGLLYGTTQLGGTGNVEPGCNLIGDEGGNCGVLYSLNIGAAPFVSLVSTTGKVGKMIGILGQGFTGTTAVSFNGTAAAYSVKSNTFLTATVPVGATTGFVTVATRAATLTSNKTFRLIP